MFRKQHTEALSDASSDALVDVSKIENIKKNVKLKVK